MVPRVRHGNMLMFGTNMIILALLHWSKIIIFLRDPVEKAYSGFKTNYDWYYDDAKITFEKCLQVDILRIKRKEGDGWSTGKGYRPSNYHACDAKIWAWVVFITARKMT